VTPGGRLPRVGLVGAFGGENLGNDASAAALIRAVGNEGSFQPVLIGDSVCSPRFGAGVESIVLASSRQERTHGRYAAALRDLFRISTIPAAVDAIVVAGGGVFEAEGTRGADGIFGSLTLLVLALGARLRGKRFALHAVGGTMVPRGVGRWIVTTTARLATRRSFRDGASQSAMVRMGGARATDPVVPDVAFVLASPTVGEPWSPQPIAGQRRVVVGVMGFAWLRDPELAGAHEKALTDLVLHLLEDTRVCVEVVYGDVADRAAAIHLWESCAATASDRVTMPPVADFADLVDHMRACEVAVCSRFHNVVAAIIAGTPVVAVTDRAKVRSLMATASLGEYVLDARSVTVAELVDAVDRLEAHATELRGVLRDITAVAHVAAERDAADLAHHLGIPPATDPA
jgi:polysaccharide pyruvyl transferase WcaK-like protein